MNNNPLSAWAPLALAAALSCAPAAAQDDALAGRWKTLDDRTGKPRAVVRIEEIGGELTGRIEQLFPAPGEDADPRCEQCPGALKGQRLMGLTILSGFRRRGEEWGDGAILDPENGRTYRSRLTLAEGGHKLDVRGYIGVPWLGRSQVWLREP